VDELFKGEVDEAFAVAVFLVVVSSLDFLAFLIFAMFLDEIILLFPTSSDVQNMRREG